MKLILHLLLLVMPGVLFAQQAKQHKPIPEKTIVLTFDDASRSHYSFVAPLLKKYGFGATFYVCEFPPDFEDSLKYMNWRQIQALDKMGFEIGNHTWHHSGLANITTEELDSELSYVENKCDSLGIPKPVSFCYPGYQTNPAAIQTLKRHGYTTARVGGDKPYDIEKDDPMYLPSYTIEGENRDYFYQAIRNAVANKPVVFTIHGVPDNAHPQVNTPPKVFEEYMQYLSDNHYNVIAIKDLGL